MQYPELWVLPYLLHMAWERGRSHFQVAVLACLAMSLVADLGGLWMGLVGLLLIIGVGANRLWEKPSLSGLI